MDTKEQSSGEGELHDTALTDRRGSRRRNFDFDEFDGSVNFVGLRFAPPVEKTLVAELMLPAKRGSSDGGLIELREPVLALLAGSSSRRHAGHDTSIDATGEIIPMGLLGPLRKYEATMKKSRKIGNSYKQCLTVSSDSSTQSCQGGAPCLRHNQPPFAPLSSGPTPASRPSRQKQIPAMRKNVTTW